MCRRFAITIAALALASCAQAQSPYPAQFGSSTVWSIPDEAFGGWSGIEVDEDGVGFTVVSDRGLIASGRLLRNAQGWLIGAEAGPILNLTDPKGAPLARFHDDSEGLAIAPDGTVYVSHEGDHRVDMYADVTADRAIELPRHPDFHGLQNNSSLEALAIGPDGTLYTLPERSGELERPFPVYRFRNGEWDQPFAIPRRGEFLAVGADIGPDGKFYLLERAFSARQLGFSTRVRRFDMGEDGLSGEVTLLQTDARTHDNLEGISVWQDHLGDMHLTMVSDDNLNLFQRSEIVEYVVPAPVGLDRSAESD